MRLFYCRYVYTRQKPGYFKNREDAIERVTALVVLSKGEKEKTVRNAVRRAYARTLEGLDGSWTVEDITDEVETMAFEVYSNLEGVYSGAKV